ncbi:MAG: hypothetical protein QXO84_00640 [Candidatus Aenigmatarchaeota archaeon]
MANELLIFFILVIIAVPILFIIAALLFTTGSVTAFIFGAGFLYILLFVGSGFLIFIGLMIAPTRPKLGKYLAYGGVVALMVLLILMETTIIGLSGYNLYKKYGAHGNIWIDCSNKPPVNMISYISCAITGHQPLPSSSGDMWGWMGIGGFMIFGITIPLLVLVALFMDFVEVSGVVQNPTYQKVIGFGLGFFAYRGFIVSRLIYILDIGSTGVAVIALNFIWLGGILAYIRRSFRQWKLLEAEQKVGKYIPQIATNLKAIVSQWKTSTQAQNAFTDPNFYSNLQLVVGPAIAESLRVESTSGKPLSQLKNRVIKAIDDAMK